MDILTVVNGAATVLGLNKCSEEYNCQIPKYSAMASMIDCLQRLNLNITYIDRPNARIMCEFDASLFSSAGTLTGEIMTIDFVEFSGGTTMKIVSKLKRGKQKIDTSKKNKKNIDTVMGAFVAHSYDDPSLALTQKINEIEEVADSKKYKRVKRCTKGIVIYTIIFIIGILIYNFAEITREETFSYWLFGDRTGTRTAYTTTGLWSLVLISIGSLGSGIGLITVLIYKALGPTIKK